VSRKDEITACLKAISSSFSDSEIIGKIVDCKLNLLYGISAATTSTTAATTNTAANLSTTKSTTSTSTAAGSNTAGNDVSPCEKELSKKNGGISGDLLEEIKAF
jgi:hypothetical protein